MDIQGKREQVYRLVKLGMDVYESQLLAGCSASEISEMSSDPVFKAQCGFYNLLEEKELLEQIDDIILSNAEKGISTEIRWKLGVINPRKYGSRMAVDSAPPPPDRDVPDLSRLNDAERAALLDAVSKMINGDAE